MIKKLLLYCGKSKPYLVKEAFKGYMATNNLGVLEEEKERFIFNGKIVAECDFEVEKIRADYGGNHIGNIEIDDRYDYYVNSLRDEYELCKKSCLTMEGLDDYLKGHNGYAIHIKNLHIFDEPRELNEYADNKGYNIKKAPQNMMYACKYSHTSWNDIFDYYILISIRPEYLVRILNKEKTIEIRKKILKEML